MKQKVWEATKSFDPVHGGEPCDMSSIKKLSDEFGFKIIEDASHAIEDGTETNDWVV